MSETRKPEQIIAQAKPILNSLNRLIAHKGQVMAIWNETDDVGDACNKLISDIDAGIKAAQNKLEVLSVEYAKATFIQIVQQAQ